MVARPGGFGADVSGFTSGFEALEKFADAVPGNVNRNISAAILSSMVVLENEINQNLDDNFYRSNRGAFQRSGRKFTDFMRRGLRSTSKIKKRPFSVEGLVGIFGVLYARIHEFGGVIKPKKTKFLAIPMQNKYQFNSPRKFPNLVFGPFGAKGGSLIDENADLAYLLLKRVEIPARPSVTPAFKAKKPEFDKKIKSAVTKGLKRSKQ